MMPFRLIAAALAALALSACGDGFERQALLDAAPQDVRDELQAAERHILVVRHARKISEDCNGLDCALSAQGAAMVERLSERLGPRPVDAALASSACRTVYTARAGGAEVVQHQPAPGLDQACGEDEAVTRSRAVAMLSAQESDARWTLVAEHSNTVCLWVEAFAGSEGTPCADGDLASDDYGDIFWLYRTGGDWHAAVLPGAFDVAAEAETAPEPGED